ncbi:MAG: hypothetical protein HY922_03215, partial [Elusimicrobia bacterium]|nr:hypothetical protein [Elusimicrobiota bacterium]
MNSRKSKTLWALSSMLSFLQALPLPACAALYRTLANGAPVGSVPSGINYQGRLIDNGFPVSGVRNMTFRLYDAALGGNLLWTSNVQSVTVSQGIFGTTLAISTSALAGTSQRYLEVQVEGTTLIPREPLNSVPYALIAKSVEESLVMSSVTVEGQLTSSGPMSLTTLTAVDGLAGITITTSAFFTAGRVGLGTTSPSAQLHLSAQAGASSLRIDGTSDAMIDLIRNLNNSAYLYFGNATTGSQVAQVGWNGALASADFHTAGYAYPMLLNASNVSLQTGAGNVGVGTTNPATKLHMSSGTLTIDGTSPAVSVGVSTFVVTAGGNVGIGISGPGQKLSVAGTIESFSGGFKFPDGNTQATAAGAGASYWGASGLDIYSSNSGKVGIGISAPGTKLDARGANAKAATAAYENVFQSASNDAANPLTLRMGIKTDATAGNRYGGIEVDDAAAERALVLQPGSGSVGIGVTNPQSKVDVEGGMAVGATYSGASAAPANGMIVEGSVGIGL